MLSSATVRGAALPWARGGGGHGGLARILGVTFATAAGGSFSLLPHRWASSLPELDAADKSDEESGGDIDWDNLGFGLTPTDYMYVMRSTREDGGVFTRGELSRYGNIELSPSSGVLNYGQLPKHPRTP